jgi:hypothetical protein
MVPGLIEEHVRFSVQFNAQNPSCKGPEESVAIGRPAREREGASKVPVGSVSQIDSLANLEHNGKLWKQLFTVPIPRWGVYATKMVLCGLLVGASFAVLVVGFIGDVLVFSAATLPGRGARSEEMVWRLMHSNSH